MTESTTELTTESTTDSTQPSASSNPTTGDDSAASSDRITRVQQQRYKSTNASAVDTEGPSSVTETWRFDLGGPLAATPLHEDNVLYAPTDAGKVYALSQRGSAPSVEWDSLLGPSPGGIILSEDHVVGGGSTGVLNGLSKTDGTTTWQTELDGQIRSPPRIKDGLVYVTATMTELVAVDPSSGEIQWEVTDEFVGMPAVGESHVVSKVIGEIRALDRRSGVKQWSRGRRELLREFGWTDGSTEGLPTLNTPPILVNDAVLVSTDLGIISLNVGTGKTKWTVETTGAVGHLTGDDTRVYALVKNDRKFDKLVCIETGGDRSWAHVLDGAASFTSVPVVTPNELYCTMWKQQDDTEQRSLVEIPKDDWGVESHTRINNIGPQPLVFGSDIVYSNQNQLVGLSEPE